MYMFIVRVSFVFYRQNRLFNPVNHYFFLRFPSSIFHSYPIVFLFVFRTARINHKTGGTYAVCLPRMSSLSRIRTIRLKRQGHAARG